MQRLIDAAPQMKDLADVTGEQLVNIGSQDMNNEVWLKLAKRVNELVRQPDVDAVVVTHGTDTMEETSYFLGLVIHTKKPIIMVGSMRPATWLGADGPMNLYEAAAVATSPEGRDRGVLVVLNDQIHYAREVEKQNTTALDTFKSPNRGPAGRVEGRRLPSSPGLQRPSEIAAPSRLMISASYRRWRSSTLTRTWSGNYDLAVKDGAKGIVVAGVGDGNMTTVALGVAGCREGRRRRRAQQPYRQRRGVPDIEVDDDSCISLPAANSIHRKPACS